MAKALLCLRICCVWGACFCSQCLPLNGENSFPTVHLAVIDVGQGDAIALFPEAGKREIWLIDAGPPGIDWDSLAAALDIEGIRGLFLTHSDGDHIGGVPRLLGALSVKKVYIPSLELFSQDDKGLFLLNQLFSLGIPVVTLKAGNRVEWNAQTTLEVLWPPPDTLIPGNDGSLVLRLDHGGITGLFTGDIETRAESRLLEIYGASGKLAADFLKVAHHGSRTSSHLAFLTAVRPSIAAISCDSLVYGHPHAEAVRHLLQVLPRTDALWRTDQKGTLLWNGQSPSGWKRTGTN